MAHDVSYYLSKGFDERTAEYFAAGRRRIVGVRPESGRRLYIAFDNGEAKVFDASPLIEPGTVFAFLSEERNFRRVYLDEFGNVAWDIDPSVDSGEVWANKVDISSDTCYLDGVSVSTDPI